MLNLVEASLDDVETLSQLEHKIFAYDIISARQMRYLIGRETATVVKAEVERGAVGYMVLLRRKGCGAARVYSLGVIAEARELGIGKKLLQYAETDSLKRSCDRLQLEVGVSNQAAIVFYLAFGFHIYGRKENYYTDGATALCLRKYIA